MGFNGGLRHRSHVKQLTRLMLSQAIVDGLLPQMGLGQGA